MYFITPNYSVAFNAKVASSTLARAIIAAFYPEQEHLIQTAAYPKGRGPDTNPVHWLCPKEKQPSKPVVLIVREPVDRFCSAMYQIGQTDIDTILTALEKDEEIQFPARKLKIRDNVHFRHQNELLSGGTAFKLENLDDVAILIGLSLPLPIINEANSNKPELTLQQKQRVLEYYVNDRILFDSIK